MASKFNTRRKKQGSRKTLPAVLVYCQGTQTEVQYFERLKEHYRLTYQVDADAKDPIKLAKDAADLASRNNYEEVYVVIDVDETPGQDLKQAIRICANKTTKKVKIHLVVSNPSFEVWLLRSTGDQKTHQRTPASMAQSLAHRGLLTGRDLKYISNEFPFDQVKETTSQLESTSFNEVGSNPSTAVGLLITRLLQLENPNRKDRKAAP